MSGFFDELKRRKVYRVAVAYVVAGGGIIQLASAAFPAWAEIYPVASDKDRTIGMLEELSKIPSPLSSEWTRINPIWDPIRDDPRFGEVRARFSATI